MKLCADANRLKVRRRRIGNVGGYGDELVEAFLSQALFLCPLNMVQADTTTQSLRVLNVKPPWPFFFWTNSFFSKLFVRMATAVQPTLFSKGAFSIKVCPSPWAVFGQAF